MRFSVLSVGLLAFALPSLSSAGTIQISNLLQQSSLCYYSGAECVTNAVVSGVSTGLTASGSDEIIALNITLMGTVSGLVNGPATLTGTGSAYIYNWDGISTGSYLADLSLNVMGSVSGSTIQILTTGTPSHGAAQFADAGDGNLTGASFFDIGTAINVNSAGNVQADTATAHFQSSDYQSSAPEPGTTMLAIGAVAVWFGRQRFDRKS